MADKIHDGHRERMRERVAKSGLHTLQPHEILEYLLYPFIPRKDTNPIAHALINKFGSFAGVINADADRLKEVNGMTENAALFLSSLPDVFRVYINQSEEEKRSLSGRGAARNFMGNQLYGVKVEQVIVAALDAQDRLICCEKISSGSGDSVGLSVRGVVDFALRHKASSILLAHNHPSGKVTPSQQDLDLTMDIMSTLRSVGVTLQDHFIFCGSDSYSFEEDGRLSYLREKQRVMKEGYSYYE